MPKWITAIFVFFLSTTLLTAKAITVEDVINRHVQVMKREAGQQTTDIKLLTDYARKNYKARLEGIETVKGRACYKISLDDATGNRLNYLIDAKSWHIIRKSVSISNKPAESATVGDTKQVTVSGMDTISTCIPAGNN